MRTLNTKRVAAIGMAGALALGTVASVGALTAADAASGTYTCTLTAPLNDQPLQITGTLTLPASVQSGSSLSGLAGTMGVTLPQQIVAALGTAIPGLSAVGGTATGVQLPVTGGSALTLGDLTIPQTTPATDGSLTMVADTVTKSGRAPLPGDYPVTMPKSFAFTPVGTVGGLQVPLGDPVPCTTGSPAAMGTMHVVKATSKITRLRLKNAPITRTERARLLTVVRAAGGAAKGKVVAKQGSRKLAAGTLSHGRKVLLLPRLGVGRHTVKVVYRGNAGTKRTVRSITFRVRR